MQHTYSVKAHQILRCSVAAVTVWCFTCMSLAIAQESSAQKQDSNLQNDALAVSGRYARFERLLSQMADLMAVEDPERAELLRRAISQSRENAIGTNIDAIARLLADDSLGSAIEKQEQSANSMAELLKLLQSEDRRSAVEKERERLNDILKNVQNTIAQQRAARAATQNSQSPSDSAPQQQKAAKNTKQIVDDIREHDDAKSSSEGNDESSQNASPDNDGKQEGAQAEQGDNSPQDSSESNSEMPSDSNGSTPESESNQPSNQPQTNPADSPQQSPENSEQPNRQPGNNDGEQKSPQGQQTPGGQQSPQGQQSRQSSPQQPNSSNSNKPQSREQQSDQTPGREQMENALQLMQEALEQIQQQERSNALEKQDDAIQELETAARELEELLKQLREEEKEMLLASLEARFQRMLTIETQIHETTLDLATTPRKQWLDTAVSECRELAQRQADLAQECSQTSGLLREDGTSVSILVAVEDIETDMNTLANRLQQTKTETLTQSMQADVIEALKELIEATQREMEEMKSEDRQQAQQNSNQKKPPLVELMAEIRVLRSLQIRVNRRTKQVDSLLLEGDSQDTTDLQDQLMELATRQDRLRESAVELAEQLERSR